MGQFRPGESGNPGGRPKGSSLHSRLTDAVGDKFDELVQTILNAALAGDMSAASLLMGRMVPAIRPIQEPMPFPMYGTTLTEKAESVLDAVATGKLSASDGKLILDALAGVIRVQDGEILAKQLEQIQAILKADKAR